MKYALFETEAAARGHRGLNGGWLALDDAGRWHWFAPGMTPTTIVLSEQLRGYSAKLF